MKLYLVGHDYRFAAEEALVALLGRSPSATVLRGKPPRAPETESVVTRITQSEHGGAATATIRSGGRVAHGRANYRSAPTSDGAATQVAAPTARAVGAGCGGDPATARHVTATEQPEPTQSVAATVPPQHAEAAASATATDPARETVRRRQHALKLAIARAVRELNGSLPAWGALTGMRPTKLARRFIGESGSGGAVKTLTDRYLLSRDRAELVVRAAEQGIAAEKQLGADGYMLYLGVPFCPTRCAYCSFVSESTARSGALIEPYVEKLLEEIRLKGELLRSTALKPKAVYFGGGTPTTLSAEQLTRVIDAMRSAFALPDGIEFTVEAGRPDTITREKLESLRDGGVTRISINPQSMQAEVLAAAKRPHSPEDVEASFRLAREVGIREINCDLIAGLEADSAEGFARSLDRILALEPDNVTIHTLARKRGSDINRLTAEGAALRIPPPDEVARMLDDAYPKLESLGFFPYYLYRQKYMAAPLENTGWAKENTVCLYNTLVMEEIGLTVALGAGGITKLVDGERVGRITNPKFAAEYIAHDFTKSLLELRSRLFDSASSGE